MARYTCSFVLSITIEELQPLLVGLLQDCGLDVQYYSRDYIMAREIPGSVTFSKLVTVEALIESSTATDTETRMAIVIKNEELPLQRDNHCRQLFELVREQIENSRYWNLIESLAG
ncbi:hypothetical protein [Calothrix sp. 336/3]|uniref:hypothetical protein n=1 Tax=Calothrix sp. 336/3 TaxID=1337936 RepID=UPI0004E3AAC1|nr:hypothetical protein [Calothrix sp. 336/3]AKG24679.1 hypothetical protein IJ00_16155 [Calothrix sp. 336/3]